MEVAVFAIFAVAAIAGSLGVVLARKPVHAALSLVLTLFCVAVFFVHAGTRRQAFARRCARAQAFVSTCTISASAFRTESS